MRTVLLFLVLSIAAAGGPAVAETVDFSVLCTDRWPADAEKRRLCELTQSKAGFKIAEFNERHDIDRKTVEHRVKDPYLIMFEACKRRGEVKRLKTYDFAKVDDCLVKGIKAHHPKGK